MTVSSLSTEILSGFSTCVMCLPPVQQGGVVEIRSNHEPRWRAVSSNHGRTGFGDQVLQRWFGKSPAVGSFDQDRPPSEFEGGNRRLSDFTDPRLRGGTGEDDDARTGGRGETPSACHPRAV